MTPPSHPEGQSKLTAAQAELLRDKFVLWSRAAFNGPMDLRDYNQRCADALQVLLSEHAAAYSVEMEPT